MRLLSARLIVSLIVGVTLVSLCTSYYQVVVLKRGLRKDLQHRAEVLGESRFPSSHVARDDYALSHPLWAANDKAEKLG